MNKRDTLISAIFRARDRILKTAVHEANRSERNVNSKHREQLKKVRLAMAMDEVRFRNKDLVATYSAAAHCVNNIIDKLDGAPDDVRKELTIMYNEVINESIAYLNSL